MSGSRPGPQVVRFGIFELDLRARELRKQGRRAPLQDKPFELLALLLEHPGEVVTRDEIRQRLWPADTFVVFDDSLNTAVKKVRAALGDMRGVARLIETVPRRGYRFVGAIGSGADADHAAAAPRPATDAHRSMSIRRGWIGAGVSAAIVVFVLAGIRSDLSHQPPTSLQFQITAPRGTYFPGGSPQPALSPDGRRLAFLAGDPTDRVHRIWVQPLDATTPAMIRGTEYAFTPFWSPDGKSIAFVAYKTLRTVALDTGRVEDLAEATDTGGGAWSETGAILFSAPSGALMRTGGGGHATAVTTLDATRGERRHVFPQFLPGGRDFLYLALSDNPEMSAVYAASLDRPGRTRVFAARYRATFVPAGWLFFARDDGLFAQRFDVKTRRVSGEPRQLASDLSMLAANGSAAFSVSWRGTLVYATRPHDPLRELAWFDRGGRQGRVVGPADRYASFDLSPDERWIAAERLDPDTRAPDIWLIDAARGVRSRVTFNPANDERPTWAPDSHRFVYARHRGIQQIADLYVQSVDNPGQDELLYAGAATAHPTSWSHDNRFVLFDREERSGKQDVWQLPLKDRLAVPWLEGGYSERSASVAPDGHWIAYASDESGRSEVYVRHLDGSSRIAISNGGGAQPRWRGDGRELFYVSADERLMSVSFHAGGSSPAAPPVPLFPLRRVLAGPYTEAAFAPTADGRRFLISTAVDDPTEPPMTVVVNATDALH